MRKLIGNGRPDLFKADPGISDEEITLDYVVDSMVIYGTPSQVAEQVLELREMVGEFETLVYAGHDWANVDLSKNSMSLMASEVMPKINAALGVDEAIS